MRVDLNVTAATTACTLYISYTHRRGHISTTEVQTAEMAMVLAEMIYGRTYLGRLLFEGGEKVMVMSLDETSTAQIKALRDAKQEPMYLRNVIVHADTDPANDMVLCDSSAPPPAWAVPATHLRWAP
jgi:hypothetical protein